MHSSRIHLLIMFTFEFDHLYWLSQFHSEWRETSKLLNFQDFYKVCDPGQNLKITKLRTSVPFIKKTLVNQDYIWIWSLWLIFTVLQWMKANFTIIQFKIFLLRSEYEIQVKIWKSLKLLNSLPFIKKTLLNHVYIRICWFSLTFTVL